MIRDIGRVGTHPIYRRSFNSSLYRGALGGTVGSDFPPKLPLRGVGGHIQGTVVGSLNKVSLVGLVELNLPPRIGGDYNSLYTLITSFVYDKKFI